MNANKQLATTMRTWLDNARLVQGKGHAEITRVMYDMQVTYGYDGDRYRIEVRQEGPILPADLDILTTIFDVPEDCSINSFRRTELHPRSGRKIHWQSVVFAWRELPVSPHNNIAVNRPAIAA